MRTPLEAVGENTAHTRAHVKNPETDASLREWRALWKRQLRSAVFFLDHIDQGPFALIRDHLSLLGVKFSPFFDRNITHVITRRSPETAHPEHDVLTRAKKIGNIKVWTLEKLERFLTSLLGHSPRNSLNRVDSTKLGQLLHKERLVGGPGDKEQWVHFKDPYVLVFDPSSKHRPIAHKEWKTNWPQLYPDTAPGICPFVYCRKVSKRSATTDDEDSNTTNTNTNTNNNSNITVKRQAVEEEKENRWVPPIASRKATLRTRQYGEIVASGIQRTAVTSAINTNAPQDQIVQSREVANLQRKVIPPPKPKKAKKARKPGFCENCYERFDNIDEHVLTSRHIRYAKDCRNFTSLDRIIEAHRRPTPNNTGSGPSCPDPSGPDEPSDGPDEPSSGSGSSSGSSSQETCPGEA